MKQVNHVGYWCFNRFRLIDGSLIEKEITPEEYTALGLKNAINPTYPNAEWLLSYECLRFDTLDGRLRDNEWANVEGKYRVGKLPGFEMASVLNNEIDSEGMIIDETPFVGKAELTKVNRF